MKHPSQATLALHAGGDLGRLARWRTERHLADCDRCREHVSAFAGVREIVPELAEIPDVPWNRLGAEMKANIRLGLEAGECVGAGHSEGPGIFNVRAFAVCGSLALLLAAFLLERPTPRIALLRGGLRVLPVRPERCRVAP